MVIEKAFEIIDLRLLIDPDIVKVTF